MRKRIAIFGLVGFFIVAVLAFLSLAYFQPGIPHVYIRFFGHTNSSDGAPIASFQLSNASPFAVIFDKSSRIELDSPSVGPEPMYNDSGQYNVLHSLQCGELEVEEPTILSNGIRWRLTIGCWQKENDLRDHWRQFARWLQDCGLPIRPPSQSPIVYFSSEWIE